MSATVISLAERRARKVRIDTLLSDRGPGRLDPVVLHDMAVAILGRPSGSSFPPKRQAKKPEKSILERIDQIAANLGIDVEAPFRPGWRPRG